VYLPCLDKFHIRLLWTTNIPWGKACVGGIKASPTWTKPAIHMLFLLSDNFIRC